ncbi:VWA domain-containing protein [Bacillus sp. APMAM]|uniref:VWA domain-containing protein n=1 Tax=Margalitia sp. FSL K6-0131 TaxID=2954604 RepID=UPI0015FF690A|nr:VWA domain-containing protein [Bacillus sp. APMAM]
MKLILKNVFFISMIFLLLCSCSSNNKNEGVVKENNTANKQVKHNDHKASSQNNNNNNNDDFNLDPLPTTYEELAKLPMGKHDDIDILGSEADKEILRIFGSLPHISDNPSKKELDLYYSDLLKNLQQNYEGPENIIRRLKFSLLGSPLSDNDRYQFKEHLNVEFIIDASGSMAQLIDGKSKMQAAKESIIKFVSKLPKDAKVGIRVYGHKGSGSDSDKILSCKSSEIVYSISNYDEGKFKSALNKFSPKGWTPIGLALAEAKKDLSIYDGKNNTNIVYLVSDGVDTCNDDPINKAKELYSSNISPIINVIGFDVDNEGQNQLKEIADATKGIYENVNDEGELQSELDKINDLANQWKTWKENGMKQLEINKINNNLDIFSYIAREESKAVKERTKIEHILYVLYQAKMFDKDSFDYLDKKDSEYHKWIQEEINKFNQELKALNENNYQEAIKQLEEKYNENTQ